MKVKMKALNYLAIAGFSVFGAANTMAQCGVPIPDGNIVVTAPEGGSVTYSYPFVFAPQG